MTETQPAAAPRPQQTPPPVRPTAPQPAPAPRPVTQQVNQAATDSQPVFAWPDLPLTRGRWTYGRASSGRPAARFGPAGELFQLECVAPGTVSVSRQGGSRSLTIRTSSAQRTLPAQSAGGRTLVQLPATDPLLDAMAFSRGRFGVQSPAAPDLIIPAWPEMARVVEECRRSA